MSIRDDKNDSKTIYLDSIRICRESRYIVFTLRRSSSSSSSMRCTTQCGYYYYYKSLTPHALARNSLTKNALSTLRRRRSSSSSSSSSSVRCTKYGDSESLAPRSFARTRVRSSIDGTPTLYRVLFLPCPCRSYRSSSFTSSSSSLQNSVSIKNSFPNNAVLVDLRA